MKNRILSISLIIGALALCGATESNAQDRQTLDLLVSKGVITRAEADRVAKDAVSITPKEKSVKAIKLIGRVQTQFENISVEEFNADGSSSKLDTKSDFLMRRMFLGMDANLGSGWSALVIADFGRASEGYLEYAYISKKLDWEFLQGRADIGYKKVTFGFEEYTSASKLLTIERSLATRYFSETNNGRRLGLAGRHTGAYWSGKAGFVDGLEYGLSVTNSYNNNPVSQPANATNNLLYAANVKYSKKFESITLCAGANFAYTNGMNVAGTAGSAEGALYGANPYIAVSAFGFDVWSEFLIANVENAKSGNSRDATPMGLNIAAEYKFDIGEFGKIAPAVRYSWIDTDGRGIKTSDGVRNSAGLTAFDAGQSIYAGINWYISGNDVKFQLGYEWAQLNGAISSATVTRSDANAVRAQMQILF